MRTKQSTTPLQTKNAVPPAGVETPQSVFEGVQPQAVVLQRTMGAGLEGTEQAEAALCNYSELHVSTGNNFLEQWTPQYLSDTFCFDFPRGTVEPEFKLKNPSLASQRSPDCVSVQLYERFTSTR